MKTAPELKQDLIETIILKASRNGADSAILGKRRDVIYRCDSNFWTDSVEVYEAICSLDEAKYLEESGYKIELVKPYLNKEDYNLAKRASWPKKSGFFRKLFTGESSYTDMDSRIAADAVRRIDNFPDVVKVSW